MIEVSGLPDAAVRVVLVLIQRPGTALPYQQVAELAGISESTMKRTATTLEQMGLVRVGSGRWNAKTLTLIDTPAITFDSSMDELSATAHKEPILSTAQPTQVRPVELTVEEACRLADSSGVGQVEALTKMWDAWFPVDEYPVQRLQPKTAKEMLQLAGGSAIQVYQRLSESKVGRGEKVEYPRGYCLAVLKGKAKETSSDDNEWDMNWLMDLAKEVSNAK